MDEIYYAHVTIAKDGEKMTKLQAQIIADSILIDLDGQPIRDVYTMIDAELIASVLRMTSGNRTKGAELLGLNRTTFVMRVKKHGLGHMLRAGDEAIQ